MGFSAPFAAQASLSALGCDGAGCDAQAWAAEIAGFAPLSLRHSKRVLNDDGAYEEQGDMHKGLFDKAWASQDVIEAQMARIEKRAARFQGA